MSKIINFSILSMTMMALQAMEFEEAAKKKELAVQLIDIIALASPDAEVELVQKCILAGADVNYVLPYSIKRKRDVDRIPLFCALKNKKLLIYKLLVQAGAKVDIYSERFLELTRRRFEFLDPIILEKLNLLKNQVYSFLLCLKELDSINYVHLKHIFKAPLCRFLAERRLDIWREMRCFWGVVHRTSFEEKYKKILYPAGEHE